MRFRVNVGSWLVVKLLSRMAQVGVRPQTGELVGRILCCIHLCCSKIDGPLYVDSHKKMALPAVASGPEWHRGHEVRRGAITTIHIQEQLLEVYLKCAN